MKTHLNLKEPDSKSTSLESHLDSLAGLCSALEAWYLSEKRELPWRQGLNPYHTWISEIMLQQTQVKTVIPYFENFIKKFPKVQDLAKASIEEVYAAWSGLGYYSRARNLQKAAIALSKNYDCDPKDLTTWPRSWSQWILLPGIGPYTSRAISSIAFSERVGVLDGNVFRVLSRLLAKPFSSQNKKDLTTLQSFVDTIAQQSQNPSHLNQSLMELGATLCTPTKPSCVVCPVGQFCKAKKTDAVALFPVPKVRKTIEAWVWKVTVPLMKTDLGLVEAKGLSFMKSGWTFPGTAKKVQKPPSQFDFTHSITHHKIFVKVETLGFDKARSQPSEWTWVKASELKKKNPSQLLQKILKTAQKKARL